jgi:flavin reductase (DIM6/NTAB) family NADH-FMN oxidoreductase RutF
MGGEPNLPPLGGIEGGKSFTEQTMKIKFGAVPLIYPIPIILAGANVDGKPNYATLGDCGLMGIKPPLVYISSGQDHYTNKGILENETYSINIPSSDMLALTDYCGIVSGKDVDKSALFENFYGELGNAPMIKQCPVNLECRVVKEFSIQHRQIFVGQVVQVHVDEKFVVEKNGRQGIADMMQLDPIMYALDNRYYSVGQVIGVGYQEGKELKRG